MHCVIRLPGQRNGSERHRGSVNNTERRRCIGNPLWSRSAVADRSSAETAEPGNNPMKQTGTPNITNHNTRKNYLTWKNKTTFSLIFIRAPTQKVTPDRNPNKRLSKMPPPSRKSKSSSSGGSSSSPRNAIRRILKEIDSLNAALVSEPGIERLGPPNDEELLSWEAVINGQGIGSGYEGIPPAPSLHFSSLSKLLY